MAFLMKSLCQDAVCGIVAGSLEGLFGITFFSPGETEEIYRLKRLSVSVMAKSKVVTTDPAICQEIAKGSSTALQTFMDQPSTSEIVAATALVVCEKAFLGRFKKVLMGACMNLTGC
jgi:hypothetical protein